MTDLRIIPSHPWDATRDRYRELSVEDRPGDPNELPHDAREEREPSHFILALALIAVLTIGFACIGAIQ